jgi:hypothetical protein
MDKFRLRAVDLLGGSVRRPEPRVRDHQFVLCRDESIDVAADGQAGRPTLDPTWNNRGPSGQPAWLIAESPVGPVLKWSSRSLRNRRTPHKCALIRESTVPRSEIGRRWCRPEHIVASEGATASVAAEGWRGPASKGALFIGLIAFSDATGGSVVC